MATISAAALLLSGAAAASTTPTDAKGLALRAQDFPRGAAKLSHRENRAAPLPGGTGHAYAATFQFRVGARTQSVGTFVVTAPTGAVARRVYAAAVADARATAAAPLRLVVLGDEQYAALYGRPAVNETSALVWVRSGTVVWQVQTSSVRNPFGFSRSEALRELAKYAHAQQRRVDGRRAPAGSRGLEEG